MLKKILMLIVGLLAIYAITCFIGPKRMDCTVQKTISLTGKKPAVWVENIVGPLPIKIREMVPWRLLNSNPMKVLKWF
jgi:sorbitol-specific phosphotransferase system component IIC